MTDKTDLGDRMKGYEQPTRLILPRRTYTIVRVDGRAFHNYLRHAIKPFDMKFMTHMDAVMVDMSYEIDGTAFAYRQSDEISLLLTDFASMHTESWFGGIVQKMCSTAAAYATASMLMHSAYEGFNPPTFDARVFTIPTQVEVANYFVWRQRDCVRNSISMAAQAHFPHKSLQGLSSDQMQEKLWQEKGINWAKYPEGARNGRVCIKVTKVGSATFTNKSTRDEETVNDVQRTQWVPQDAPQFSCVPDTFLAEIIPPLPTLATARRKDDSIDNA